MRNTTGTRPFTDTTWFAINKTVIRYTRKDSVGSIVRAFPNGRRRKPPIIRARCYAPPGSIDQSFVI